MPSQNLQLPPPPLDPHLNSLLIAEFTYIADSTNKSSEDRARVSNYYLATIAAAAAAVFGRTLDNTAQATVNSAIGIGFLVLALIGLFTVLSIIRLRAGWMAGANAMDAIKEYCAKIYDKAQLDSAFEWERKDLPPAGKINSVAFWTASSMIAIDSAMMALAVIFGIAGISGKALDDWLMWEGLGGGLGFAILQLVVYWRQLPWRKPNLEASSQEN